MTTLYLASASARRKQLLAQLGYEFTQFSVDADESQQPDETPLKLVERLARLKAQTGVEMGYQDKPVLAYLASHLVQHQCFSTL